MRGLLLLSVLALCGCARGFYKPGADYQTFYSELRQCEAENTPASTWCAGAYCDQQKAAINNRRNQCMLAHGWELTRDEPKFVP